MLPLLAGLPPRIGIVQATIRRYTAPLPFGPEVQG